MKLGSLSAKYESNGDPATVSSGWGDAGGVSYGQYQLASNTGSVHSFVRWLRARNHPAGNILNQHNPGSREFSAAWIFCAKNIDDFGDIQHDYIKYAYYDVAVELLREIDLNIEKHSNALKQVIWSRAVQYGTGYMKELFTEVAHDLGYPNCSYMDDIAFDEQIIRRVYAINATPEWTSGSPALREGLYERFANECVDALEMYRKEVSE